MVIAYTFWQSFIAWFSFVAIAGFLISCIADLGRGIARLFAGKNPPSAYADMTINQMYADNVTVNRDPTIPVGDFNPKHAAHAEYRRKR